MNDRRGLARGVAVVVLALGLIGLGVRSLVDRTVERSQAQRERLAEDEPREVSVSHRQPPAEPEAQRPSESERPRGPEGPGQAPTRVVSVATPLDDPRTTPLAPGAAPALPPPPFDQSAPQPHRGSLPPMVVRDVVHEALPELRFCFEWQLAAHPELHGRVTMEWTIAEDGSVLEPSIAEDALGDETVARCFAHVVGGLHFPAPDGDGTVRVRYPFMLDGAPEARRPEGI